MRNHPEESSNASSVRRVFYIRQTVFLVHTLYSKLETGKLEVSREGLESVFALSDNMPKNLGSGDKNLSVAIKDCNAYLERQISYIKDVIREIKRDHSYSTPDQIRWEVSVIATLANFLIKIDDYFKKINLQDLEIINSIAYGQVNERYCFKSFRNNVKLYKELTSSIIKSVSHYDLSLENAQIKAHLVHSILPEYYDLLIEMSEQVKLVENLDSLNFELNYFSSGASIFLGNEENAVELLYDLKKLRADLHSIDSPSNRWAPVVIDSSLSVVSKFLSSLWKKFNYKDTNNRILNIMKSLRVISNDCIITYQSRIGDISLEIKKILGQLPKSSELETYHRRLFNMKGISDIKEGDPSYNSRYFQNNLKELRLLHREIDLYARARKIVLDEIQGRTNILALLQIYHHEQFRDVVTFTEKEQRNHHKKNEGIERTYLQQEFTDVRDEHHARRTIKNQEMRGRNGLMLAELKDSESRQRLALQHTIIAAMLATLRQLNIEKSQQLQHEDSLNQFVDCESATRLGLQGAADDELNAIASQSLSGIFIYNQNTILAKQRTERELYESEEIDLRARIVNQFQEQHEKLQERNKVTRAERKERNEHEKNENVGRVCIQQGYINAREEHGNRRSIESQETHERKVAALSNNESRQRLVLQHDSVAATSEITEQLRRETLLNQFLGHVSTTRLGTQDAEVEEFTSIISRHLSTTFIDGRDKLVSKENASRFRIENDISTAIVKQRQEERENLLAAQGLQLQENAEKLRSLIEWLRENIEIYRDRANKIPGNNVFHRQLVELEKELDEVTSPLPTQKKGPTPRGNEKLLKMINERFEYANQIKNRFSTLLSQLDTVVAALTLVVDVQHSIQDTSFKNTSPSTTELLSELQRFQENLEIMPANEILIQATALQKTHEKFEDEKRELLINEINLLKEKIDLYKHYIDERYLGYKEKSVLQNIKQSLNQCKRSWARPFTDPLRNKLPKDLKDLLFNLSENYTELQTFPIKEKLRFSFFISHPIEYFRHKRLSKDKNSLLFQLNTSLKILNEYQRKNLETADISLNKDLSAFLHKYAGFGSMDTLIVFISSKIVTPDNENFKKDVVILKQRIDKLITQYQHKLKPTTSSANSPLLKFTPDFNAKRPPELTSNERVTNLCNELLKLLRQLEQAINNLEYYLRQSIGGSERIGRQNIEKKFMEELINHKKILQEVLRVENIPRTETFKMPQYLIGLSEGASRHFSTEHLYLHEPNSINKLKMSSLVFSTSSNTDLTATNLGRFIEETRELIRSASNDASLSRYFCKKTADRDKGHRVSTNKSSLFHTASARGQTILHQGATKSFGPE